jgi:hypothetical protein
VRERGKVKYMHKHIDKQTERYTGRCLKESFSVWTDEEKAKKI